MSARKSGKIYYGWWIVAASSLCTFLEMGIGSYSYGVFYVPYEQDFGWSRAEVAFGMSVFTLAAGAVGFLAGRLTDSYGPRVVMLLGAFSVGISFMLRSFITDLWQLYALQAIMGGGISALGTVPISTVIANWFVKKRGLAIGITMTGTGFGGLFIVPLAQYLVTEVGWRWATALLGGFGSILVLPLILFVMKGKPADMGLLPDGDEPGETISSVKGGPQRESTSGSAADKHLHSSGAASEDWELGEALRTPIFWVLTLMLVLTLAATGAVLNHEIPYLVGIGIDAQTAAAALGLTAGMGVIGKLVCGVLTDRIGYRLVFIMVIMIQGIGVLLLLATRDILMVWIFVIVFGFGMGGAVTLRPMMAAEVFGVRSFGSIYGLLSGFGTVGGAIGPLFAGLVFDITRSYEVALFTFMVGYIVAIALLIFLRAPKRKAISGSKPSTSGTVNHA